MANNTPKSLRRKPLKPHKDFPLTVNGNGQWSKKIHGKVYYFGAWEDPDGALERYLSQENDLFAGRAPRATGDGLTVRDLVNRFLTSKQQQVDTGEIVDRTFQDYFKSCERLTAVLGKSRLVDDLHPDDFRKIREELAESRGLVALFNEIGRIRVVFNFAYNEHLIDHPMRYGANFKRPARKVLRRERQKRGKRMFQPSTLRSVLNAASGQLKTMILLGINCGFGNSDVGTLPLEAVDLERGWIDYPRPKTGIERRCPLWPETVCALREAIENRRTPIDSKDGDLVFITKYGHGWAKETSSNPVSAEFRKLTKELGVYKAGLGFYALRHTFETVGGETTDQVAVGFIMGHAREDMSSVCREHVGDDRLTTVCNHVRNWLSLSASAAT